VFLLPLGSRAEAKGKFVLVHFASDVKASKRFELEPAVKYIFNSTYWKSPILD